MTHPDQVLGSCKGINVSRNLRVPKPLEIPVPTVSGADVGHCSGEVCDSVKTPGREEHTCHPVLGRSRPADWVRKSLCGKEEGRKEGGRQGEKKVCVWGGVQYSLGVQQRGE